MQVPAFRASVHRSFEAGLLRAKLALHRCRSATVVEATAATRRGQPASARRAGRARSAPWPRALRAATRAGARLLAGPQSCAFAKDSRQGHFLNIPLQAGWESNSLDSKRTKEP